MKENNDFQVTNEGEFLGNNEVEYNKSFNELLDNLLDQLKFMLTDPINKNNMGYVAQNFAYEFMKVNDDTFFSNISLENNLEIISRLTKSLISALKSVKSEIDKVDDKAFEAIITTINSISAQSKKRMEGIKVEQGIWLKGREWFQILKIKSDQKKEILKIINKIDLKSKNFLTSSS